MKKKKTMATANTAKASNKNKKPLTLNEFRAWLAGVEEMQSDDWTPDPTQWSRIRAKIEDIQDNPRSFKSDGTGPSDYDEQPARVIRPAGPSSFTGAMPGPMMPAPVAATPPPFMNTSGVEGAKIRTPNVDTSGGPYASSLE